MLLKSIILSVFTATCLSSSPLPVQDPPDTTVDPVQFIRTALDEIYQNYWNRMLEESPWLASRFGNKAADFQLGKFGLEQVDSEVQFSYSILQQIRAYEVHRLPSVERQQAEMLMRTLENNLDSARIGLHYTPISQRRGPQVWLPTMASRMQFQNARDHEAYLSRLSQAPRVLQETMEVLRKAMELGFLPPRVTLDGVLDQITTQTKITGSGNPLL